MYNINLLKFTVKTNVISTLSKMLPKSRRQMPPFAPPDAHVYRQNSVTETANYNTLQDLVKDSKQDRNSGVIQF